MAWLTTERDWPWRDGDGLGWPGFALVAALLVLLTLWTYAGQRRAGWGKILCVLGLRLGALGVIALLLLRPSFASEEEVVTPGKLIIVLDKSLSMKIGDGLNSRTRWDTVRMLLEVPEVKEALEHLKTRRQIDIVIYEAAEDVARYDPAGDADGKRTDMGQWLHSLMRIHRNDRNLRGLLLFSDGADNGTRFATLDEAAKWRELPCPIHAFGAGSEATTKGHNDIIVTEVRAEQERQTGGAPDSFYVKSPVRIKAVIDAPNMEGQIVKAHLLVDGKPVGAKKDFDLRNTRGNIIDVGEFVPQQVGEIKVTVKVDEVPGEFTTLNNEMSTYVTVRKEGISVLWVEGRKRLEATWIIRHALDQDPRFSIKYDERTRDGVLAPGQKELFDSPDKAFDVIVIGDVSAARFSGGDPAIFERIKKHVDDRRTGVLMLGGFHTFANGDWPSVGKALADVLPVELNTPGQIDDKVRVKPDDANRDHRLLQLAAPAGKHVWDDLFHELTGMSKLGKERKEALVLARTEDKEPIFVVTKDSAGRAAVFGGDTTYKAWCRNEDAMRAFSQFWIQLMAWLAHQEEGNSQVWIKLDKRRLAAGANQQLGFTVGLNDKNGQPVKNARFKVKVFGPNGETFDIAALKPSEKPGEERGAFAQANAVGEYKAMVTATVPGPDGKDVAAGSASARFLAFAEDVENQRPQADHKALARLAAAGGGTFRLAGKEELLQYLRELRDRTGAPGWVKRDVWPNWKTPPASDALPDQLSALVRSLALPCFILFVLLVCTEWGLRRWWGLV
jgi:uncharacterized membrane protein